MYYVCIYIYIYIYKQLFLHSIDFDFLWLIFFSGRKQLSDERPLVHVNIYFSLSHQDKCFPSLISLILYYDVISGFIFHNDNYEFRSMYIYIHTYSCTVAPHIYVDRKKVHWKKHIGKSTSEKRAYVHKRMGKKRRRKKAHQDKSALGKKRTCTGRKIQHEKKYLYRCWIVNKGIRLFTISLCSSKDNYIFLSLCSLWYWPHSSFVIAVQTIP